MARNLNAAGASLDVSLKQIAPPIILLGAIMASLGLAGTMLRSLGGADIVLSLFPILAGIASAYTLYRILRLKADFVLVPIVLFMAQVLIVSSIGPAVHSFGMKETLNYLSWRPIAADVDNLAGAIGMSYLSIGLILISAGLVLKRLRAYSGQTTKGFNTPVLATAVFLIVGAAIRYLLVTPARWGLINVTLPGILVDAAMLFDVGIGLLCYLAYSSRPALKPLFWILLIGNMSFSLFDFSKLLVVLPAIISILFHFLATRRVRTLLVSTLILGVVYSQIGPLTTFARSEMNRMGGRAAATFTASERMGIIEIYLDNPKLAESRSAASQNPQAWWTRVNYTQQQAFAMSEYEAGRPGDSLAGAWMLFIPRAIWQDKPIIYPPGKEFFRAVTGKDFSFMAATIYGDMYWQFGWAGVVLVSPLVGLFFAWLSQLSHRRIVNREFVYLPVVLLGMLAALQGTQQYLLNGILATVPVVLVVQWLCGRLAQSASQNSSREIARV